MRGLRERIVWLHVDLPGQEDDASDLTIEYENYLKKKNQLISDNKAFNRKYPTLIELGYELVEVLQFFKLSQVICFGEGAGANICARFAMQHPTRSLGVILVNPSGSAAGFFESMTDKVSFGYNKHISLICVII